MYWGLQRGIRRMLGSQASPAVKLVKLRNLPPVLKDGLLMRQEDGNKHRIEKLIKSLDFKEYHLKPHDVSEITKCFYPTKCARLRLANGKCYTNKQLELLGRELLLLSLNETFLNLFKKSHNDVAGYDFNFEIKMLHMNSWKKKPRSLLSRFLKWNGLTELARVPMPQSQVPPRIQRALDQKVFDAIIGYVSVTNDPLVVNQFLQKRITKQIAQKILLR